MTRRRMHNHTSRLVNDDGIPVFIINIERNVLRLDFRRFCLGYGQFHSIAFCQLVIRFDRRIVYDQVPRFNPQLNLAAGDVLSQQRFCIFIDSLFRVGRSSHPLELLFFEFL
ncbi:hypothetical protein D3C74_270110 [compost metagenome]